MTKLPGFSSSTYTGFVVLQVSGGLHSVLLRPRIVRTYFHAYGCLLLVDGPIHTSIVMAVHTSAYSSMAAGGKELDIGYTSQYDRYFKVPLRDVCDVKSRG